MSVAGWFPYSGVTTLQHYDIKTKLTELFDDVRPSQVLEIGTSLGGLTMVIRDSLDELGLMDCDLMTYDIVNWGTDIITEKINNGAKIKIFFVNIFKNDYTGLSDEHKTNIIDYIQRDGKTIIMCDGMHKIEEVNILSEYLKQGDIIMSHDYSPDIEFFNKEMYDKIWNWIEITDNDCIDSINKFNLQPYKQTELIKVAWMCKIRI